jgi:hypothetical protein
MRRNTDKGGYVSDGLILHLDAIKNAINGTHSNSTTTWYDLSPSANNVTLVNPSWSDTYLTFTGTTRGQTASNLNLSGRNKCTIEILLRTSTNTSLGILMEHSSNYNNNVGAFIIDPKDGSPLARDMNVGVIKNGSGQYLFGGFNHTFNDDIFVFQYDDTTNVSSTELEQYVNFVKKTLTFNVGAESTVDTNMISAILYIGARAGGLFTFLGSFLAIRVYNRKLTLEELYQNKLEDFKRYGIIK